MICDICQVQEGSWNEDLETFSCYYCAHVVHYRNKKEAPKFHIPRSDKKRSKPRIRKDAIVEF